MAYKEYDVTINKDGSDFYLKWKKDTITSLIVAPVFFLFVFTCFSMIVGISIKLLLILILPVAFIVAVFIYIPLFVRRKYINNMANSLKIKDGVLTVETYKWFRYNPIKEEIPTEKVKIENSNDDSFFRGKKIHLLSNKGYEGKSFYIIDVFFDEIDSLISQFN